LVIATRSKFGKISLPNPKSLFANRTPRAAGRRRKKRVGWLAGRPLLP